MKKRWQLREIEIIQNNLQTMTYEEIKELLPNRTLKSIKLKITEKFGSEIVEKNKENIIKDYVDNHVSIRKLKGKYNVTIDQLKTKLTEWNIAIRTKNRDYLNISGSNNKNWTGFGEIPGRVFNSILRDARKREISFHVTIEDLWNLFLTQKGQCALSGVLLKFNTQRKYCTASLDRIDYTKPYCIENLQWVHKDVNIIKNRFSKEQLLYWCNTIMTYQSSL